MASANQSAKDPSADKDKKAMKIRLCVLFLSFWITCTTELKSQEAKPTVTASIEAAERVFSSSPKLALTGVIGARLDESSGHGLANKQIRVTLVDWMQSHAEEIEGLDKQLPLIMQLDRLSNKQIVEILSAADPLAKEQ